MITSADRAWIKNNRLETSNGRTEIISLTSESYSSRDPYTNTPINTTTKTIAVSAVCKMPQTVDPRFFAELKIEIDSADYVFIVNEVEIIDFNIDELKFVEYNGLSYSLLRLKKVGIVEINKYVIFTKRNDT